MKSRHANTAVGPERIGHSLWAARDTNQSPRTSTLCLGGQGRCWDPQQVGPSAGGVGSKDLIQGTG